MERLLILLAALLALTGCHLSHKVPLGDSIVTHRTLVERPYEELGLVHAETWGPTVYWRYSATSLKRTVTKALTAEAKKRGADAVIDVDVRVENHYSVILSIVIFGWEECHATGTAIKYKK